MAQKLENDPVGPWLLNPVRRAKKATKLKGRQWKKHYKAVRRALKAGAK